MPVMEMTPTRSAGGVAPSAVVWINHRRATVSRKDVDGRESSVEILCRSGDESAFLAEAVRAIGDRERVLILGPNEVRLALEREYVAEFGRPDRLVDVDPSGPLDAAAMTRRLRRLAS